MTCYDLYSLRDPTCCCACWENMRNGYGEKQSYSGYILNHQDYGADTFSPVDWFKELKVKPGESSLSGVYGKCRCSRASCPTLTLMAELQQAEWREHLGSGLGHPLAHWKRMLIALDLHSTNTYCRPIVFRHHAESWE